MLLVLTLGIISPSSYPVSATGLRYDATQFFCPGMERATTGDSRKGCCYWVLPSYACATRCVRLPQGILLRRAPPYACATRCPGVRARWYRACAGSPTLRCAIPLLACYVMSGTSIAYAGIGLWGCYAMCGTDMEHAYGAAFLSACYTMCGTAIVYGGIGLCACYTMSGTDIAYAATTRPIP
eukprot:1393091-Rhodomonas_salina.1